LRQFPGSLQLSHGCKVAWLDLILHQNPTQNALEKISGSIIYIKGK
jgi:hypothetical protein